MLDVIGFGKDKKEEREINDFYKTHRHGIVPFLDQEKFSGTSLEPAVGDGAISSVYEEYYGKGTIDKNDIIDRGIGANIGDFLASEKQYDNIITNPPFKLANDFVKHSLNLANKKIAMLVRIQFLEGEKRFQDIFKNNPPTKIYFFRKRINIDKSGDFEKYSKKSPALAFAWFVWDKQDPRPYTYIKWLDRYEERGKHEKQLKILRKTIIQEHVKELEKNKLKEKK